MRAMRFNAKRRGWKLNRKAARRTSPLARRRKGGRRRRGFTFW